MKKYLIVNGSPRGDGSMTMKLVREFLAGAAQIQEADVKVLELRKLKIGGCLGCYACWRKTPGVCVQRDDMTAALEAYSDADVVIWATPVYHYGMTSLMKKFLERTLPLLYPYQVKVNGLYTHPRRRPVPEGRKNLVFATCGFPDQDNFRVLQQHFQKLFQSSLSYCFFVAEGELLHQSDPRTEPVLEHIRQAGSEWQQTGTIREELMQGLRQHMVPVESFVRVANMTWNVPGETPPTPEQVRGERSYDPLEPAARASTLEAVPAASVGEGKARPFMLHMASAFNPARAEAIEARLEFVFTDLGETYQLHIAQGRCSLQQGAREKPTTRISTGFETWKGISEGRIGGQKALFDGLYRVEGDFSLLMRIGELFTSAA